MLARRGIAIADLTVRNTGRGDNESIRTSSISGERRRNFTPRIVAAARIRGHASNLTMTLLDLAVLILLPITFPLLGDGNGGFSQPILAVRTRYARNRDVRRFRSGHSVRISAVLSGTVVGTDCMESEDITAVTTLRTERSIGCGPRD